MEPKFGDKGWFWNTNKEKAQYGVVIQVGWSDYSFFKKNNYNVVLEGENQIRHYLYYSKEYPRPKPKYIPYDLTKEKPKDLYLVNKINGNHRIVEAWSTNGRGCIRVFEKWIGQEELLTNWLHQDGTPCGKKVEE